MKKGTCLLLHRLGWLQPFTFVQWLATYRCNFQCAFCEASANAAQADELNTGEVLSFLGDLAAMGAKRLVVSGGEPLVRDDLAAILKHAAKRNLKLGLVSNGYLTRARWPDLVQARYFLYFTSLDGPRPVHDAARVRCSFDRVMESLDRFAEHRVPLRIVNTVVHPKNLPLLPEMLGIVSKSSATRWHLTPLQQVGRADGRDEFRLNGLQLRQVVEFVAASRKIMPVDLGESHTYLNCLAGTPVSKPFFCGAGLTRCAVMPEGSVLACQQVYDTRLAEGNIRERSFSRIWRESFKDLRQWSLPEYCAGCDRLGACQGGCWAEMKLHQACLKSVLNRRDGR
jgi:radical SAM protein with 4Fe4S-binding SPASM domain